MLVINPREVRLGARRLDAVAAIAVDRAAGPEGLLREWGDEGPHAVLVDVVREVVTVRVTQSLAGPELDAPRPGELAELSFVAPLSGLGDGGGAPAGAVRCRVNAVVTAVKHSVRGGGSGAAGLREIELAAQASDGAADPVIVERA
jgi:hypothetical protein